LDRDYNSDILLEILSQKNRSLCIDDEGYEEDAESGLSATCEVVGSAMYPSLSIVDVRSEGKNTLRLWDLMSVDQFNLKMNSVLSSAEVLNNHDLTDFSLETFGKLQWFMVK
jgi:hypothetical protein